MKIDNEISKKLIEEIKKLEQVKEAYKVQSEIVDKLMEQVELGSMFQDEETKLVYKVQRAKGKFISFPDREFVRTKKAEEKTATLSKKEAEENGFKV